MICVPSTAVPLQRYWQRKRYRLLIRFAQTDARTLMSVRKRPLIADLSSGFGVDIRPATLRYLRGFSPLLAAADGLSLPFPDASFECVVSSEVIEHIPNENGRFIDELTRVLKPGGVLVIGTPDYDSRLWCFFEYLYEKAAPDAYAHEHVTHYTFSTLGSALESRGYEILDHGYVMGSIMVIQARKTDHTADA